MRQTMQCHCGDESFLGEYVERVGVLFAVSIVFYTAGWGDCGAVETKQSGRYGKRR